MNYIEMKHELLSLQNKLFPPPPGLGFLMYGGGGEGLTSPPPAHMGIPALHIDLKSGSYLLLS